MEENFGIILIVAAIIGLIPATIAYKKGYNFLGWWFFGFGLFIVALPYAIVMKRADNELLEKTKEDNNFSRIVSDLANLKAIKDTGALSEEAYEARESELKQQLQAIENSRQKEQKSYYVNSEIDIDTHVENLKNMGIEMNVDGLTDDEKYTIIKMASNLESGNVIIKHSVNKKIEVQSLIQYQDWIKHYGEKIMILIASKK